MHPSFTLLALTATGKVHWMRDGVVSVNAQRDQHISGRIRNYHLKHVLGTLTCDYVNMKCTKLYLVHITIDPGSVNCTHLLHMIYPFQYE